MVSVRQLGFGSRVSVRFLLGTGLCLGILTSTVALAADDEKAPTASAIPPAPTKVEATRVVPDLPPAAATGAPVDPRSYEIGPDDVLYIRVWREQDFTGQVAVRPDGKITLPLVGDIQAAGLTPDSLGVQVKQALTDYIYKPEVTVIVMQVNSKKYFITGEVNRPGSYPLVVATHVFDALSYAGGLRDFANRKDIVIIRGDKRLRFNYNDVIKGKKLDQNVPLENGDTIIVK